MLRWRKKKNGKKCRYKMYGWCDSVKFTLTLKFKGQISIGYCLNVKIACKMSTDVQSNMPLIFLCVLLIRLLLSLKKKHFILISFVVCFLTSTTDISVAPIVQNLIKFVTWIFVSLGCCCWFCFSFFVSNNLKNK